MSILESASRITQGGPGHLQSRDLGSPQAPPSDESSGDQLDSTTDDGPRKDDTRKPAREPRGPEFYNRLKWVGLVAIAALTLIAMRQLASVTLTLPGDRAISPVLLIGVVAFAAITLIGVLSSRIPNANHPPWLLASRPIKPGPRRLGWMAYYVGWDLYRFRWVPVPRTVGLYSERRREFREFVYGHRKVLSAIVAKVSGVTSVTSGKGGCGKTTITSVLATELRVTTNEPVVAIDADSGKGAIANRFELSPDETVSTDCLVGMVGDGWSPTVSDANRLLGFHDSTGVAVTYMEHGSSIVPSSFDDTMRALRQVFPFVIVDTTAGYKEDNSLESIRNSLAMIVPGNIHADDDMAQIIETLNHPEYGLRARYERGEGPIIAISAVRWWQYNVRTVYELAERFDVDPEYIVLLPYNRWMKNQRPVNFLRETSEYGWPIGPKYRYAASWLLRRWAEIAIQHNRNNPPAAIPGAPVPLVIDRPADDDTSGADGVRQEEGIP